MTSVQQVVTKVIAVINRAFDTRQTRGVSAFAAAIGSVGRVIKQVTGINLTDQFNALGHAIDAATASFQNAISSGLNPIVAALLAVQSGLASIGGGHTPGAIADLARGFGTAARAVEEFGNVFGAVFTTDQARGINAFSSGLDAVGKAISVVTGVDVTGFFGRLAQSIQAGVDTFTQATNQGINPLEAGLIGLRQALSDLIGLDLRGFTDVLGSIAGGIRDIGLAVARGDFVSAADVLGNLAATLGAAVSGLAVDLVDWTLNVAAPTLIGWVETAVTWLAGQIGPLVSGLPAALGEVKDWLLNVGLPTLGGWVDVAATWLSEHIGTVVTAITGLAVDFAGWVLNVGAPTLAGWVNIAATWIGDQLRPIAAGVAGVAVDFAGWVLNVGVPTLAGWVNAASSWLHDTLTGVVQAATGVAADFATWVVTVAAPTLAGWVSIAASWLHDTLSGVVSGAAGVTADFSTWVVTVGEPTLAGWVNIAGAWMHDNLLPVVNSISGISEDFHDWVLHVLAPTVEVDVSGLTTAISTKLSDVLSGVTPASILDVATFASKIGAFYGNLWRSINTAIVSSLSALGDPETLGKINQGLAAVGAAVLAAIAGFATGFVLGEEVDFHQLGDSVRQRIQGAIDSIGQAFSGETLQAGLGGTGLGPSALQGLSDQLFNAFQQTAIDIGARLSTIDWSAIPNAIKNGIGDALANFGTQLFGASTAEAASANGGAGFDAAAAGQQFGAQFVQAFQDPAFVGAVKDAIDQIPTAAFADVGTGLMAKIGAAITASLQSPVGVSESGVAGGAGLGGTLITNIVTGLTSAVSGADFSGFATAFTTNVSTGVSQGLQQITSAMQAQAGVWLITLTNAFSSMASAAATGMTGVVAPVTAGMQQITSAIGAQAAVWLPTLQAFLAPMANALASGFDAMFGAVQAEMTAITTAVTTGLQQITSALELRLPCGRLRSRARWVRSQPPSLNGMASAAAAAQSGIGALVATLQGAANQAFASGQAIGEGLARGMQSALTDVQVAAAALSNAATDAIAKEAQVSSPSKKTILIGQDIAQGLAVGIVNRQDAAVQSAHDLAAKIFDNWGQSLQQQFTDTKQVMTSWADWLRQQSPATRGLIRQQRDQAAAGTSEPFDKTSRLWWIGQGSQNAPGSAMSSWSDWISQQSHNERLSLRRAREAGQLTAQHRQDLMAGGSIADFVNDTSRRTPPQPVHIHIQSTLDGQALDNRIIQTSIGGMTQVPHRGGHRNSRFGLAGA
jgi:hypothetical protein